MINENKNERSIKDKKTYGTNAKLYFREYCENTSIHGLKYLSDNQTRLLSERIWWIFSIFISLSLCITLIMQIYSKWENTPVIVSFATKETPIWQIPFPVVTLCPETKSVPRKFDYKKHLSLKEKNLETDPEEEKKFGLASFMCKYNESMKITANFTGTPEEILQFYDEIQPDFFKIISDCKFMRKHVNCSEIFTPIFTDVGICYSFNLLDRNDIYRENVVHYKNYQSAPRTNWTVEHGYSLTDGRNTYPRRALFSGVIFALEAVLTVYEEDLDFVCSSAMQGFMMDISHPSRVPRPKYYHSNIPLDQAVMVTLFLDMMSTSKAVKNYPSSRRNCYMPDERHLRFFKVYTQQNCKLECLTNFTMNRCGCSMNFMPRERETRICSGVDYHCFYNAEMDVLNASMDEHLLKLAGKTTRTECDCLPICTKMNYNIQISQLAWKWKNKVANYSKGKHMSTFKIFFKDNQFITSERNELFGRIDFIANLGGLLGLFIGFSLLSLIEIIYYLTLRIFANVKLFGKKNWSGKSE